MYVHIYIYIYMYIRTYAHASSMTSDISAGRLLTFAQGGSWPGKYSY